MHFSALADRRHRDLPHVSSPAHAPQFRAAAALARVCPDVIGTCASEGERSAGLPITASTMPIPTKSSTPTRRFRDSCGLTCAGGCRWTTHSKHTPEYYQKWCPDLCKDPVHLWLEQVHIIFPLLLFAGLYCSGRHALAGLGRFRPHGLRASFDMAGEFGQPRLGLPFALTRDHSTNLWWVALLTYGEGWHNNHHAFQTSAQHGLRWWEIDMTYIAIWMMKRFGIAYDIKLPKIRSTTSAPAWRSRPMGQA